MSPFKLLVFAVAAAALLWIFLAYIAPLFFQEKDPAMAISSAIETAEFSPGKAIDAGELWFKEGGYKSSIFEQKARIVAFECNSPTICCDKGTNCQAPVSWSEQGISFKEQRKVKVFARCLTEHNVSACKAYFGKKPAQIELLGIEAPKEIDVSKTTRLAGIARAKNSGDVQAINIEGELKLYRIEKKGTWEEKTEQVGFDKRMKIVDIVPGENGTVEIRLDVDRPGDYFFELTVSGENAGFDKNRFDFKAVGTAVSSCGTGEKSEQLLADSETGKCKRKAFCNSCDVSQSCLETWEQKEPGNAFKEGDAGFAWEAVECS